MLFNSATPTTLANMIPNAFVFNTKTIESLFCTYEHWVATPDGQTLIYVGCCRLRDVYLCPDARRNPQWQTLITEAIPVELRIIATADHQYECMKLASELVGRHRPYCNMYAAAHAGKAIVTCVTTGKSYPTSAEAAINEGVSTSALSNHLNGRPGYKSVKGKMFRRGS